MSSLRILSAALVLLGLCASAGAQTANSAAPSASGSGTSTPQFPSGGATTGGTAAGQNATSQFPSSGAAGAGSKIGAPTQVERQEQQKSDASTKICKGC